MSTPTSTLGLIEAKVIQEQRLTAEDALALFRSQDLIGIGRMAALSNSNKNGRDVFYNINRHINPTNICVNRCLFCAFSRTADQEGAYALQIDEMCTMASRAEQDGATEVHIVGGLHPDLPFSFYTELLASIRAAAPSLHIKAFTAVEIDYFAQLEQTSPQDILNRLRQAGLGSLPGGGAEILVDAPRLKICPEKISGGRWLEIHRTAHQLGIRSNATMLYGHVESIADRVKHMTLIRELQDETGGYQAFIPLVWQPENSPLKLDTPRTSGIDSLKTLAISRLFLDNFQHIKAYWVMLGEKIAQTSLAFGVNDLDGTVIAEKIGHDAGATSPQLLSVERIRRLITDVGRTPVERDTLYRPVLRP